MITADTTIRPARLRDLKYIDALCARFSREVGFIPRIALENRINGSRNGYVGLALENGDPAGFLHTGSLLKPEARIFQAAIQYDAQRCHHGKALVNDFIDKATRSGVKLVTLRCLSDLDANAFWKAMGFVHVGTEAVSGSKNAGKSLFIWARRLHTLDDLMEPGFVPPRLPMRTHSCQSCGRKCTYSRGPNGELWKLCGRCVTAHKRMQGG